MVSTNLRAKWKHTFSALILFCAVGATAHAQTTKKAKKTKAKPTAEAPAPAAQPSLVKASGGEEPASQGDTLKFNTDSAPVSTDRHETMRFSDPGETPVGAPRAEYAESAPEDVGYKAYLGYPKHQLGLYALPINVASSWTGSTGQTYNFTSSDTGYGVNYKLLVSPLWNIELDYQHFTATLPQSTVKFGTIPFTFAQSTASFDNYFIRNRFCVIGKSTFYQQLCPGLDISNDSYPIVNYTGNSSLAMSKVQDIIVGANLTYQIPASQSMIIRLMAGYNYGTGIGNSGTLTSKNNSSYFGDASLDWNATEHNVVTFGIDYKARAAKVSGTDGVSQISWQTDSATISGRVGYARQF